MTRIRCKIHGDSYFFQSCKHVRDLIINKKHYKIKTVRTGVYIMYICTDCIKMHGLEKYEYDFENNPDVTTIDLYTESEEFWNKFEQEYDKMEDKIGWCSKCYNDLMKQ